MHLVSILQLMVKLQLLSVGAGFRFGSFKVVGLVSFGPSTHSGSLISAALFADLGLGSRAEGWASMF